MSWKCGRTASTRRSSRDPPAPRSRARPHEQLWDSYVRRATCPSGTVAFGGGANVVSNGVYDVAGLSTFGTKPEARSWTYGGAGDLGDRTLLDRVQVPATHAAGQDRDRPGHRRRHRAPRVASA
jgi:hypothetical protein